MCLFFLVLCLGLLLFSCCDWFVLGWYLSKMDGDWLPHKRYAHNASFLWFIPLSEKWLCCWCCCYVFYGSFLFWRRRVARSSHGIIFCCPMYYKRVVYWYLYLGSVAIDGSSIVLRAALEPTLTFLTWKFSVEMRLKWSPSIFLRSNAKFDAVAQD